MYKYKNLEPSILESDLRIEKMYSTYAYFYAPKFVFDGEWHKPWELIYVNSGEVIIETPKYGKTVTKGQVFLHTPNEKHKIRANNVSCNMYFLSFDCECEKLYEIAHKPINITPKLKNYIMTIVDEGLVYFANKNSIPPTNKQREYASGQIIKNLMELLLIELIRYNERETHKDEPTTSSPSKHSVVSEIIKCMRENIRSRISLNRISSYIGYSIPRICSLFKQTTGKSIMAYFAEMRISKAKELMAKTDMSLTQISEYLDFDTVQYFSKSFKKVTGLSPSHYVEYLKSRNFQYDDATNLQFFE